MQCPTADRAASWRRHGRLNLHGGVGRCAAFLNELAPRAPHIGSPRRGMREGSGGAGLADQPRSALAGLLLRGVVLTGAHADLADALAAAGRAAGLGLGLRHGVCWGSGTPGAGDRAEESTEEGPPRQGPRPRMGAPGPLGTPSPGPRRWPEPQAERPRRPPASPGSGRRTTLRRCPRAGTPRADPGRRPPPV